MRIGLFSDSYKPYQSGVVTSISTLKEELNRYGHEVYIFAPSYPNYEDEEPDIHRYFSVPSPTNPDFTLAIPGLSGMSSIIKKLNLDLIHVHSPFTMGWVGKLYANKYKIPLVFTYHTLYESYAHYVPVAQDLAREMASKFSTMFCNHCDHIVVPSPEIKDVLLAGEVQSPISVIPTGVSLEKFTGGDPNWLREQFNIPYDKKILLFVGRLTKEKNLEFLIRAFQDIHHKVPDTVLVLTARGPLEQNLKELSEVLGVREEVIFTGALPFETLVHAYHSADLFVFSSMTETQGLVLLEAMACGLPVVAVRASGVQDMVDDEVDGLLTECRIDKFSEAVCRVLGSRDTYEKLKANSYKKADKLSSTNMAKRLEELYLELMPRQQRRRRVNGDDVWNAF
ncbi:MAG: glycosyltransferase family 4 protein [Syntrophomonadaceae bacterium]